MKTPQWESEFLSRQLSGLAGRPLFETISTFLLQADTEDLLHCSTALGQAIPELMPMLGFDQHSPYHAFDLYTHTANVTGKLPRDLTLRWAGLLHDMGKVPTFTRDETGRGHFRGHPTAGATMATDILCRLDAPEELRQAVPLLIREHMTRLQPDKEQLRQCVNHFGWDMTHKLLLLQQADMGSKGIDQTQNSDYYREISSLLEELK